MYLFFDTETTGLPKNYRAPVEDLSNWPRLVQLAFVQCADDGTELEKADYIIKPDGFTIPDGSSAIHGISTEKALMDGKPLDQVMNIFHAIIKKSTILVAHNISFDEKIIGAEFLRCNMENPIPAMKKICTMSQTTDFCKIPGSYGYKWPKLQELHVKLFGCEFEEAHNAASDISATVKCFFELKKLGIIVD